MKIVPIGSEKMKLRTTLTAAAAQLLYFEKYSQFSSKLQFLRASKNVAKFSLEYAYPNFL